MFLSANRQLPLQSHFEFKPKPTNNSFSYSVYAAGNKKASSEKVSLTYEWSLQIRRRIMVSLIGVSMQ